MLNKEDTVFVLVDVQGKLAKIVHESEEVLNNLGILIQAFRQLEIPIIWLEQYPEGLGATTEEIAKHLNGLEPIPKMTFSACETKRFIDTLEDTGRNQILVGGIEAHICVYQTAMDLKQQAYDVQIVADAVSSRTLANKEIGIEKMKMAGIPATSVEMALFELLKTAENDMFKPISKLIK